jgi:hypothetical protein
MYSLTIICSTVLFLLSLSNIYCDTVVDPATLQKIVDQLTDIQKEKILQSLMGSSLNQGRQDNSNWCCSIDAGKNYTLLFSSSNHIHFISGVEATSKTRQTTYYVERHARNKCGYSGCGLFGWSSCTRWCDTYWSEMQHGVETYIVYTTRLCPAINLVCCAGYITVINHCFTYQEVLNNKDILEILVALGIPISPTMG